MQLPIAEFTYDELHGPLGPDEGLLAERAVAADAERPTRSHTQRERAKAPEHREHAISSALASGDRRIRMYV